MSSIVTTDALTVSIPSPYGSMAAFHIIDSVSFDDINNVLAITVKSYQNQAAYASGMNAFIQQDYNTQTQSDYSTIVTSSNFIQAAYSFLSNIAPFKQ